MSGNAGETVKIGVRTVAIRYGRVVASVSTTGVWIGPIEEIEALAQSLDERLSAATR
jgi:hypothetical protein